MGGRPRPNRLSDFAWWSVLAAAVLLTLSINPVGFIGGGNDDWQYLNAARCWREFGPCLPHNHWQSRWPVIAPLAIFTSVFGESRATVGIAPLLASLSCLLLVSIIGNRTFGKPIGWIAALLLLMTPTFATEALDPSAGATELALILVGVYASLRWIEGGQARWSFAAGLFLSLALQVRETALAAVGLFTAYVLYRRRPTPTSFAAAATGFFAPFAIEFAAFRILTGDPLWRLRLAVHHVRLQSSELLGPIDTQHPPFFNKSYIAHWKHVPGVHINWAIDAPLNLLLNAFAGISLALVPLLLLAVGSKIPKSAKAHSLALWAAAAAYCCILIYAFAIDPTPRMFMPALVASNLALALICFSLWQCGSRALPAAVWAIVAGVGLTYVFAYIRTAPAEQSARSWMGLFPGQIETDGTTRKALALVKGAEQLPTVGSGHFMLLYESTMACGQWMRTARLEPQSLALVGEAHMSRLRRLSPDFQRSLCLFRYESSGSSQNVMHLIYGGDGSAGRGPAE
jgi:4-amino-4-deoxy-L-arabinose transferase-like glycosyltransferase